jgi:hypothetical protein
MFVAFVTIKSEQCLSKSIADLVKMSFALKQCPFWHRKRLGRFKKAWAFQCVGCAPFSYLLLLLHFCLECIFTLRLQLSAQHQLFTAECKETL